MIDNSMPLYEKKDFSDIGVFSLRIGTACNMHCRHCSQMPIKENDGCNFVIAPKVWNVIGNLISYLKQKQQTQFPFLFWGGEPLLYWDCIKDTILRLEKDFCANEVLSFRIVSNGLLLTKEMVDFINEHNIVFGFSYDAPHPFAVRGYVSDAICKLVNQIDNCVVYGFVNNKYNCDPLLAYRCLTAKFPNVLGVRVSPNLTMSFDIPNDIYDFDWEVIKQNYKKLRIAAQLDDVFALQWFMERYMRNLLRKYDNPVKEQIMACISKSTEFCITPTGNCSFCSNSNYFISTVDDSFDTFLQNRGLFEKQINPVYCSTCPHLDICGKHCLLDMCDNTGKFITCDKYYIPLYDIVKNELRNLNKPLSQAELLWFKEQENNMVSQVSEFLEESEK